MGRYTPPRQAKVDQAAAAFRDAVGAEKVVPMELGPSSLLLVGHMSSEGWDTSVQAGPLVPKVEAIAMLRGLADELERRA